MIDMNKNPRKILIVKPSSLGDVVHSLPFLNAMKTCFPEAEIHWVVARGLEGLLDGNPMIERLWVINKDAWKKLDNAKNTVTEIRNLFKGLKKEKFDLVIDLQGLLRSGIITKSTGAPVRIGFHEAREGSRFFYTHKVKGGKDIHAVDRYLKIASVLGCNISHVSFPFPPEYSSTFNSQLFTFNLPKNMPFLSPEHDGNQKMASGKVRELASRLPVQSVIVGSKADRDIADLIVSLSEGNAVSLAGKTSLKELITVIRKAKFVISNDSGPMHIAAALGIPVYAIFGPTDPRRTGPYGKGHTIITAEEPCAPCFKKTCDDVKCLERLSVDKVFEIVKSNEHM
ncbi:lipopolysaccharide heptosyltransferase II [sediment metagenome]|uniref:lipopolysaccharide heptosyltransferase II n=1 Tax=sediment metagenome TaxID=749907 RepID=D9PG97_9ZZZZ